MKQAFLTAWWRHLVMINYEVNPALLQPYLPAHTILDFFDDRCLVSLVGFLFDDIKIKGVAIPFHTSFPEINLRFYVKHYDGKEWKRGVVFIKETVPKPAITLTARLLYKEKYATAPVKYSSRSDNDKIAVNYQWKNRLGWNEISVETATDAIPMQPDSEAAFIFEHYWGYSKVTATTTNEYGVQHPSWHIHPVLHAAVQCNFAEEYGTSFGFLQHTTPASIMMAAGSAVAITGKTVLR